MSIQNLVHKVLQDGARSSKFNLEISFSCSPKDHEFVTQSVPMLVKSSNIPSRGHKTIDLKYQGRVIPVRGQVAYSNDWKCTFYLTADHKIKKIFEDWINGLDEKTHFESKIQGDLASVINAHARTGYAVDMKIKQLDFMESKETCGYILHGVFPYEVSDISLDYSGPGELETVDISFKYVWWEAVDG